MRILQFLHFNAFFIVLLLCTNFSDSLSISKSKMSIRNETDSSIQNMEKCEIYDPTHVNSTVENSVKISSNDKGKFYFLFFYSK
jgi:hypothetical protein